MAQISIATFSRRLPDLGLVVAGTVLLCLVAFWNGFPLVYSDTGAYLASAFEGKVPLARPIGYGLFIRYTALGGNIWLPLIAQSLLFSWLLLRTVRVLLPSNARLGYAVAMAVTVGLTGMGWYASQLMPDVFVGLVVLGFFLLLFDRRIGSCRQVGGCIFPVSVLLQPLQPRGLAARSRWSDYNMGLRAKTAQTKNAFRIWKHRLGIAASRIRSPLLLLCELQQRLWLADDAFLAYFHHGPPLGNRIVA